MPLSRPRTSADVLRELQATEQRLASLVERWQTSATSDRLPPDGAPSPELLDHAEELLRHQRGAVDRLHQLWIEFAQSTGQHAPQ